MATKVNVCLSIIWSLSSLVVFKQNATFSPLFSLYAVYVLVGRVSVIFLGLKFSTKRFTFSRSGYLSPTYLTKSLQLVVTSANKSAALCMSFLSRTQYLFPSTSDTTHFN